MSTTANINLNELYFEFKALTKIIGKPTFNKLHEMFWQLKVNTAAVPCTLVGGANGYLGVLVRAAHYNTVSPGPTFVPPPMPGVLAIDPEYTKYQISMSGTQYDIDLHEHQTYILIQRSLITLVQQVVESKYTNSVRNHITGQLPAYVRLLKPHLFDTYVRIN